MAVIVTQIQGWMPKILPRSQNVIRHTYLSIYLFIYCLSFFLRFPKVKQGYWLYLQKSSSKKMFFSIDSAPFIRIDHFQLLEKCRFLWKVLYATVWEFEERSWVRRGFSPNLFSCGKESSSVSGLVPHRRTCHPDLGKCSSAWLKISDLGLAPLIMFVTTLYNHLSVAGKRKKALSPHLKGGMSGVKKAKPRSLSGSRATDRRTLEETAESH